MGIALSNLRYADAAHAAIDMDVAGVIEGEAIPFTYHADDAAPLSVAIKALLAAGSYEIAAYVAPVLTAADLIAYANAKQWAVATGGRVVTINGTPTPIATTMDSMELMSGKVQRLHQADPPETVNWQTGPTTFMQIAAADFEAMATGLADFFQATFDALPAVFDGITGGMITTTVQIDAVFAAI
jgi:hypothetical protein